jgi:anaerobic selenocysteine-containing dehydrogenase
MAAHTRDVSETAAYQTCPLCEAACGLEITIRDGRPSKVRGDRDDPQSNGYLCPKGASIIGVNDDPDRLRQPMIRRDGVLCETSWQEALAEVQRLLGGFVAQHGRDALATYIGNPAAHNLSLLLYLPQLVRDIGSGKHFSTGSVDTLPKRLACALVYGHSWSVPVPDIDRTNHLLIIGANPLVSNGSMLTAPGIGARLAALRARGGRFVVIDPVRTRTAAAADEHVFIRPGTDVWLLAAMVHVLFRDELVDLGRAESWTAGVMEVQEAVSGFTPGVAESSTGIPATTIERLARELADRRPAAVYGRVGTCLQEHGTLASWLIEVLNVLTGNLDEPGGAVFPQSVVERARDAGWLRSQQDQHARFASRVNGLPETFGDLPAAALADDILEPGDGRIRGLISIAANPALSVPGSARMDEALADLELLVCIDNYLNETTRHADVILPGEGPLERSHFPFVARFSVNRYARWTDALEAPSDRPREWEVVLALAAIVQGLGDGQLDGVAAARDDNLFERRVRREVQDPLSPIAGRDPDEIIGATDGVAGPARIIDFLLRVGSDGDGYGAREGGLSLAVLRREPHGVQLGPPGHMLPGVLATRSEMIELAPARFVEELATIIKEAGPVRDDRFPFLLVGRRNLRSNNSWMHNVGSLMRGRGQCTLLLNAKDAARLDVAEGSLVRVSSATGEVEATAEVTEDIGPGVVSLPHGWGHTDPATRLSVAAATPGVNSNLLGDARLVDRISGNSVGSGIPVDVGPVAR